MGTDPAGQEGTRGELEPAELGRVFGLALKKSSKASDKKSRSNIATRGKIAMSVGEHFRRVGHIHGIWIICVLLAIISGLMLRIPNGDKVAEYISFSSSIASLALAIVAIFYSIISNQRIAENLGSLDKTSARIDRTSDQLEGIANSIESNFSKIFDEFGLITPEMRKISEKVDKALEPQTEAKPSNSNAKDKADIGIPTYGAYGRAAGERTAWYTIAKSIKTGKEINTDIIFKDSTPFRYYVSGYLTALGNISNIVKIDKEDEGMIFTPILKSLNADNIIDMYLSAKAKALQDEVDNYFE